VYIVVFSLVLLWDLFVSVGESELVSCAFSWGIFLLFFLSNPNVLNFFYHNHIILIISCCHRSTIAF